jgi:hypothetical protein
MSTQLIDPATEITLLALMERVEKRMLLFPPFVRQGDDSVI